MACFTITAGEAVLVSAAQLTVKVLEHKGVIKYETNEDGTPKNGKWSQKLGILNGMLWGGSVLLALEHVFHGEVVMYPPFLTAMESPDATAEMLHEMATVGVAMAVTLTVIWGIGLLLYRFLRNKKVAKAQKAVEAKQLMHFVITLLATFVAFLVWYIVGRKHKAFHLEIPLIMLGAASMMWMVDCFACLFGEERKFLGIEPYIVEEGKIVGEAGAAEMQEAFYQAMNDIFLAIAIIAAALFIYGIILIILDPLKLWRKEKAE